MKIVTAGGAHGRYLVVVDTRRVGRHGPGRASSRRVEPRE